MCRRRLLREVITAISDIAKKALKTTSRKTISRSRTDGFPDGAVAARATGRAGLDGTARSTERIGAGEGSKRARS
ncbi:hypothetical protein PAGU2638_20270 [Lysobacter sp. PAGU 2638]